jgi:hypothetical protein
MAKEDKPASTSHSNVNKVDINPVKTKEVKNGLPEKRFQIEYKNNRRRSFAESSIFWL